MTSDNHYSLKNRIICVSFPRSGSRFLKELLLGAVKSIVYYEPYVKKINGEDININLTLNDANLIKTHDFNLHGKCVLSDLYPSNRKYIIQIRKPLDAITSWYELYLKTNSHVIDNESTWLNFLETKLAFWRGFYEVWVRNLTNDCLLIVYDELHRFTLPTLYKAIKFIDIQEKPELSAIKEVIKNTQFKQYPRDITIKTKVRDITEFKYYDAKKFNGLMQELDKNYPLKQSRLINYIKSLIY